VPSRLGYLLDLAPKDLEKVIYFAAYMITEVDTEARHEDFEQNQRKIASDKKKIETKRDLDIDARLKKLEADLAWLEDEGAKSDIRRKQRESAEREIKQIRDRSQRELDRLDEVWERFKNLKIQDLEGDEQLYREMRDRFGMYFKGSMGAAAIKRRLETFDLKEEAANLRQIIATGKGQKKTRALKRLRVVSSFLNTSNSPTSMVLDAVPVIPPDLRPMVQLDGGRFATSDLNDLYRRVINRNNRLKRLADLGAPEIIVNNEKRMLQEAVDALFDNGRRGRPVTGPGNRALKSLSDMLKGKQGRFRQNLLGKRVDYSGRSVIVVGPQLKLHQCGLPKQMALELFKPFVMKRLVDLNHAQNIKSAKRMVERARSVVWDVLEEVIAEHPVLLNRAPTLHRLGIQAFEPQLIEGKAIQIHPLVCTAFNADFDGDQMAVHLPLSAEAQAEARILMLSSNNILSPANGRPITSPTQDMVLGLYFLTQLREGEKGEGRAFSSTAEALMAFDQGSLSLQSKIKIRIDGAIRATTLGRALFNEALPADFQYVEEDVTKKQLGGIVNTLAERYPKVDVATTLDGLKALGFHWATRAGVTIGIEDVVTPPNKQRILDGYESDAERVQKQYEQGLITDDERRQELIEIWTKATHEVAAEMEKNFPRRNPVWMMVFSGARGNMMQVRQIAGMRGLVANPKGEIIPRPIKSNFREGLSVLEYFISTHGARKGLADTALRTADSGYLTRRLCDVAQDVIIREEDCGTDRGLTLDIAGKNEAGELVRLKNVEYSVYSRNLAEDVVVNGEVIGVTNADLGDEMIERLLGAGIESVKVRSVLTCESKVGQCAACYGRSLAAGHLVDVGEAVGIIAAQSIGEPGTQLTMRTFHTGGAAQKEGDITHGLPRVVELFEAREPKAKAPIAEHAGRVRFEDDPKNEGGKRIVITPDNGNEENAYPIPRNRKPLVNDGDRVDVGQKLIPGTIDPKDVLRILGPRATQVHLVEEIQKVYDTQGVAIHDKHIEVIVRQMLKRITILEAGDTLFLPGELVERVRFEGENRRVVTNGGTPASGRAELMGITKASLATESWLSAASFQETTRVLTDAALGERRDNLVGLKENVIIGKLIPAGTGLARYRNVRVEATEEAKASVYANYEEYDFTPFESQGSGEAVRLDDFEVPRY
jgi:DNA-directed RNA polymerase subunit beta'